MPRPEKVQAVEEIKERLENAEATFLTEYRGLSVNEQQELRRGLRAADAEYTVVKMSLARLAAAQLGLDELTESMMGPTAIAFANGDPIPVAKALKDFAKDHEHLVLKVGLMSGKLLAPEQVSKLADIESRDVLLGKIAGAAKAPLAKMAGMLGSFMRDSASMFSQLLEKKESGEPSDEAEETPPVESDVAEEIVAVEEPATSAEAGDATEEADESAESGDAEPATEAAAEAEEPAAETDETPAAKADDAAAEGDSEEAAESDDSADSDSESDDAADEAEEE
jgi:large subunit ribosomal protein L10